MNYLLIDNLHSKYRIKAEINGENLNTITYIGYTKKQAIKKYREDNNLRYKHLTIIDI